MYNIDSKTTNNKTNYKTKAKRYECFCTYNSCTKFEIHIAIVYYIYVVYDTALGLYFTNTATTTTTTACTTATGIECYANRITKYKLGE